MASFMDNEAVESEDEELSDDEDRSRAQQMKKSKKARVMSSDEDDDEDEDDEEKAREEMKGFIADDDDEEGSGSGSDEEVEGSGHKKRRRSRSRSRSRSENDEDIDEEDMELLQENLGIKIKKARKRIRMGSEDEDSEEEESKDRDELPDIDRVDARSVVDDEDEDEDNFIVDEEGRPLKRDRKKKTHIFSDSALQLADDIFTVAVDYDLDEEEEEDEEYESELEDMDDEEAELARQRRRKLKKRRKAKTIFEEFEPEELERRHYTDKDNEIRNTDIPERMQLRDPPVTQVPEGSDELDRESEWIFKHHFCKQTVSKQEGYTSDVCRDWQRRGAAALEKIRNALDFIRQGNEPPFIAFYRKEYVEPELIINDLWKIFYADALWCKLQSQKQKLQKLYQKMQAYQGDLVLAEADQPLREDMHILSTEDIDKIDAVESFEDLRDREQYFKLHFSRDLEAMHEWDRRKKQEERETRKTLDKVKKKRTKVITNEEGDEIEVTDDEDVDGQNDVEEDDDEPGVALKQARRNDQYTLCLKYGLAGIVTKFGLSAEQFGENLRDGYQRHDVDQDPFEPLEVAANFVNDKFTSPELVLSAAKYMVAMQIARDPLVMKVTREAFYERATLTVRPTKQGVKMIDESHDCYALKYVRDKPIRTLHDDQWLRLTQAEEQKLLEIELGQNLAALTSSMTFLDEAKNLFKYDAYSKAVQKWNELRSECVDLAFNKIIYPTLRKELRLKLTREAKDGILRACRKQLHDWIKIGKYDVSFEEEDEDDWGTENGCRIMALMYEDNINVASYAAVITPDGEMEAFVRLGNLLKRKDSYNQKDREAKLADLQNLKKFIQVNRPHCIVVGVSDRAALDIKRDVEDVVKDLIDGEAQFPRIGIHPMDDNLANVFASSQRAEQDFRDYPAVLRKAISLARRMQDPLIEFAQLTGAENEILCLRYHPYQDLLSSEELLEGLTIEFVNRTCQVGLDINMCVAHNHMSNLVQFVGGLGPRKGAALLKTLRQMQSSQRLENRQQLVTLCHMGPKVLINCAGFIKIDTTRLGDSEVYVEVLDGSRIHNEAYEWARKMAVDALEYDEEEGNPANALEEILQEPEKLNELDLDAFAEELERQRFGKKHITLQDIRNELNHMYKDLRDPYRPPDTEEVFNMVTKETPRTFYIGKLVEARVTGYAYKAPKSEELDKAAPQRKPDDTTWQCPFCGQDDFPELTEVWNHFDAGTCPGKAIGVKVRLDNGVTGFIPIRNLSDSQIINPAERVQPGQVISCRITKINIDRMTVECICKSSALQDNNNEWKPARDEYYDFEAESKDIQTNEAKKANQRRQTYIKRVIVHPNFYNIAYKEAEKLMETMEQGDVIFRPSSKGEDRLTVTWKVSDNIYQHIDIQEKNKANAFSLGNSLWIGNEEFEDLDEIIARFINPMASHARDILNFKYCRDTNGGDKSRADEIIKQEKKSQPGKIHYFLSPVKDLPGKFLLTYLPRDRTRHEYVTVTPEGFKYRRQNFDTLSSLIKWFKEHFREPIPGGTPVTPRTTNRTPYLTGTPGAITPGAMSMAAGTPYGTTPIGYGAINTPYTPSGQTPVMTPYNTPGPSITPRIHGSGSNTPRQMSSGATPSRRHPGSMPPPSSGGSTPMGRSGRSHQPSPMHDGHGRSPAVGRSGQSDRAGWQAAADAWARSSRRTPRAHEGAQTPKGYTGSTTPRFDEGGRSKSYSSGTPKGFADSTPLYDER